MSIPFSPLKFFQDELEDARQLSQFARERLAGHHGLADHTPQHIAALRLELLLRQREESNADRDPRPGGSKWQGTRYDVLKRAGGKCALCGASVEQGAILHVDHIKPISKRPDLAKEESNLQALCAPCNLSKAAR